MYDLLSVFYTFFLFFFHDIYPLTISFILIQSFFGFFVSDDWIILVHSPTTCQLNFLLLFWKILFFFFVLLFSFLVTFSVFLISSIYFDLFHPLMSDFSLVIFFFGVSSFSSVLVCFTPLRIFVCCWSFFIFLISTSSIQVFLYLLGFC